MKLLKPAFLVWGLLCCGPAGSGALFGAAPGPEWYQLKIYHLQAPDQAARLDEYLQRAYLPALHRAGIARVGVFKPAEPAPAPVAAPGPPAPAEQLVFVLVPCRSEAQCLDLDAGLAPDRAYRAGAQDVLGPAFDRPAYARLETVVLRAFAGLPALRAPALRAPLPERVYELRSYESATPALHENKVAQFNNGEIGLFRRLGFNTVFCGQVVAGSKMPNLMYLSAFENREAREAHWKTFGDDAEWKALNARPEYAHNMQHMDIYLLHPAPYSDF